MTESIFKNNYGVTILAEKGSGKTIFLASEANKFKKFVFVDVLGVLNPDNDFKTGYIPKSHYYKNDKNGNGDAVDMFKAGLNNKQGIDRHVIDFSEVDDQAEAMNRLCEFLIRLGKMGHGYPLFVDEVDDVMPQSKTGMYAVRVVKNGRNYGIRPFVCATQRPQGAEKKVIELADRWMIGGETGYNTLKHVTAISGADESTFKNMEKRTFYDTEAKKLHKVANYRYAEPQK